MNARLLAKGYTPISNEITLQMPGFKKPVECCFTKYKNDYDTWHQFVMGSKYVAFGFNDALKIDNEDYLFIWEMAQKFEYTGTDVKETLLERARAYVRPWPIGKGFLSELECLDFLQLPQQEQLVKLEMMRKERIREDPNYPLATSGFQNLETYIKCCQNRIPDMETKKYRQRIKEFYGL